MVICVYVLSSHLDDMFLRYRFINVEFHLTPKTQEISGLQYILKQHLANDLELQKEWKEEKQDRDVCL